MVAFLIWFISEPIGKKEHKRWSIIENGYKNPDNKEHEDTILNGILGSMPAVINSTWFTSFIKKLSWCLEFIDKNYGIFDKLSL